MYFTSLNLVAFQCLLWLATLVAMPARGGRARKNRGGGGRRPRNPLSRVPRIRGPVVPQNLIVDLIYSVRYDTSTASTFGTNSGYFLFSGNSVFNPDLNVTLENYPIGVTNWANLYARYHVISSSLETRCSVWAPIVDTSLRFCVWPHAYSATLPTGASDVESFVGQPLCSEVQIVGPVSGISVSRSFKKNMSTARVFARPPSQLFNDENTSGYLVNNSFQPNSQWFWFVVFSNNVDGVFTIPKATFEFKLRFRVSLYHPRAMASTNHSTLGITKADPSPFDVEPDPCSCRPPEAESKEPEVGPKVRAVDWKTAQDQFEAEFPDDERPVDQVEPDPSSARAE